MENILDYFDTGQAKHWKDWLSLLHFIQMF